MKTLAGLVASLCVAGCGGPSGPPRHPVAEMTARTSAKLDLVELVVSDPDRAERVRRVYLQLLELGREFDLLRQSSLVKAGEAWRQRAATTDSAAPAKAETLELVLAPPLADSSAAFDRYVALMLEARSLLTQDEFERLDRAR